MSSIINLDIIWNNNYVPQLECAINKKRMLIEVVDPLDKYKKEDRCLIYCGRDNIYTYLFHFCMNNYISLLSGVLSSRSFIHDAKLMDYILKIAIRYNKLFIVSYILSIRFINISTLRECLYLAERFERTSIIPEIKKKLIDAIVCSCLITYNSVKDKLNVETVRKLARDKPICRSHMENIASLYINDYVTVNKFVKILKNGLNIGDNPNLYAVESLMIFFKLYDKIAQ